MILNRRLGPYILLKELALGGMARLFLALKLGPSSFHKLVVLKCVLPEFKRHPDYVRLFYDEATLTARFQHPNVIHTYDVEFDQQQHYMVMEYLSGVTLADIMEQPTFKLPIEFAVNIILDAAAGLHYAHTLPDEHGQPLRVVHRDVSPHNIFVTFDGQTKIFDFGIAQQRIATPQPSLAGKYAYMSPEQCRSEPLDARSDIFSLAIVLFELTTATGSSATTRLFKRDDPIRTLRALTEDPIPYPSSLVDRYPRYLERVLMKALSRDLDQRYETALDFCEDLRKFIKISGTKPTAEALGDLLREHFATQYHDFNHFLCQALHDAEAVHGRRNPLQDLPIETSSLIPLPQLTEEELQNASWPESELATTSPSTPSPLPSLPHEPRSSFLPLLGIMALLLSLTTASTLYLALKTPPTTPITTATPAPPPPSATTWRVIIESSPPGAAIFLDQKPTQQHTPATFDDLPNDTMIQLRLEKPHYLPFEYTLIPDSNSTSLFLHLEPDTP